MTTEAFKENILGKVVPMLETRVRSFYEIVSPNALRPGRCERFAACGTQRFRRPLCESRSSCASRTPHVTHAFKNAVSGPFCD